MSGVVESDRDQRITVGPHVVSLKKGRNEVPEALAEVLVGFPGVTQPSAKASQPKGGAAQSK
jgi:hypothetical protein